MKYLSTRGKTPQKSFCEVLLMGLAPDGGLMLPTHYPDVTDKLDAWRDLSYQELAFAIMSLYVDDIPADDLRALIDKTYTADTFGTDDITPVAHLIDDLYLLGLSNGPTLAFKDIAMQFLGNAFEYVLARDNQRLTIIGATSGDTGSAAEYALRGKKGIEVFMLSPYGKMSDFQRAQMYSLDDANIHNIAIKGMFDDCQDIVKALQEDADFKRTYSLGTVNSINWGRILAQIVYYFKAVFALQKLGKDTISVCVPSGNFGNVCAGHIARQMGLPIHRLIVATNENDVLNEFFNTGCYVPRKSHETFVTSSPSMDISKASNFERFIYLLMNKDADKTATLFEGIKDGRGFEATGADAFGFCAGRSSHQDRLDTIARIRQQTSTFIDPHTADGVFVAQNLQEANESILCAETALPVKFEQTMQEALGEINLPRPMHTQGLEDRAQHVLVLDNDKNQVADAICRIVTPV